MKITVGIPTYNPGDLLESQLRALLPQLQEGDEIIVLDDCSTENIAGNLLARFSDSKQLRIIRNECNSGIAFARNRIACEAKNDYLAFCDSDDIVSSNWLDEMRCALGKHSYVGGALCIDEINSPYVQRTLKESPTARGLPKWITGERYAVGCNIGVSKQLMQAAGGFDENLKGHEDVDFGLRLSRMGYPAYFAEYAVIHYRLRPTVKALFKQNFNYGKAAASLTKMDYRRSPDSYNRSSEVISSGKRRGIKFFLGLKHPMRLSRLLGLKIGARIH